MHGLQRGNKRMIEKIKLKDNEIYVVKEGKLHKVDKPKHGFGKTVIHWENDKVTRAEITTSQKI